MRNSIIAAFVRFKVAMQRTWISGCGWDLFYKKLHLVHCLFITLWFRAMFAGDALERSAVHGQQIHLGTELTSSKEPISSKKNACLNLLSSFESRIVVSGTSICWDFSLLKNLLVLSNKAFAWWSQAFHCWMEKKNLHHSHLSKWGPFTISGPYLVSTYIN